MNAIYARQSVDKKDSLSIEGQVEQCRKFADGDALVFTDRGFSGKNTKRPAFTELMQAVEEGRITKILVYRLDRFSRSIADFSRLWEVLQQNHVEFQSVTEQFDTSSPMGRAMLNIVLVFAQLERETTAERVKDNYVHRFSLGAWVGGPAPYGFDLTKIEDDGRRVSSLAANANAEVVKLIFEEYIKPDASLRSVARLLNERGVHGPRRERWDNVTLSRMLHSPLYVRADENVYWHYLAMGLEIKQELEAFDGVHACGVIGRRDRSRNKYNSPEGQMLTVANHEGFIDSELWLSVQAKLAKNVQISKRNAGKYSWLTGLMKCGKCGYALKVNYIKSEDKPCLVCSGRSNLSACDAKIGVELGGLEEYVAARIQEMIDSCPPESVSLGDRETAEEILAIDRKIERLVAAIAESSEVSAAYISKQIDRLSKQRDELVGRSAPSVKSEHLDFAAAGFEEKKVIAAEFIERVLIDGDKVEIVWKV